MLDLQNTLRDESRADIETDATAIVDATASARAMMPSPRSILLIDDHDVARLGIAAVLGTCTDFEVTHEARTAAQALEILATETVDVVLLDLSLPDQSGMSVLRQLRATGSTVPVLVVSLHDYALYAINTLEEGANGYIEKDCLSDELIHAVRTVLAGRRYINEQIAAQLAAPLRREAKKNRLHETLSRREFEVFMRIASGESIGNISNTLHLSTTTVSTHRKRILQKMILKNNAELTYYALKNALLG